MINQFLLNGIVTGSIYALGALSFALVYNTTKVFHIAWAALPVFASFLFYSFFTLWNTPLILSIIIVIGLAACLSMLIEILVYRPLYERKYASEKMMVSSIGVLIIIVNLIAMIYGNETKILDNAISPSVSINSLIITQNQIVQFVASVILSFGFLFFLHKTNYGTILRGMDSNSKLISIVPGLNIAKERIRIYLISGALAAVVGGLIAYDVGTDPYVGMPILLNVIVAMIIGGVGRYEAAILGGFILGILQSLAVYWISSRWEDLITFGLLLVFLTLRPQGLIGKQERLV